MGLGVADEGGDVVVGEEGVGEDLGRGEAAAQVSFAGGGGSGEGCGAYGRLSMPWQDRVICSRCAARRDMVIARIVYFLEARSWRASVDRCTVLVRSNWVGREPSSPYRISLDACQRPSCSWYDKANW